MRIRTTFRPARRPRLILDRRGAAIVEFALLLPIFAAMLVGIVGYAQYFLLAHSAQQFANDAARAAIAGLTTAERRALAASTVASGARHLALMRSDEIATVLDDAEGRIVVRVTIDARRLALLSLPIVPMPDPVIERRAVALPGGTP